MGIDVVRRPTGGRAVLHAEEITYAVITPLGERTPQQWYALIHQTIAQGLTEIGLNDSAFVKSQPKFADVYREASGALCFSSSARYELEWEGKKFVGSAQRVIGDVLLQHGSILLGRYHRNLPRLLKMDEAKREHMTALLDARAVSIGEILGRELSYEECCAPLRTAFEHSLLIDHVLVEPNAL
jgi:lipoate-protein ligase A